MTVKNKAKHIFDRWRKEYDFKTFINASGSLAATLFFALYNGFLGIWHSSLWHGTICCYYLMLFLVRGLIIAAAKRISMRSSRNEERARDKVYFAASFLLLLLNISLILPVSLMVVQRKPVSLTLTPAIVMAAYTTYKVTMAAVNLRKRRKSSDCLVWLLRTVNFMDALVSILTLQNTLIMVCSNGRNLNMLPLSAPVSAVVWVTVLVLSVTAIHKGSRRIRGGA